MTPDWTPTHQQARMADALARRYGREGHVGMEPDDVRQHVLLAYARGARGPQGVYDCLRTHGPTTRDGHARHHRHHADRLYHEDGTPDPPPAAGLASDDVEARDLAAHLWCACPTDYRGALAGLLRDEDPAEVAARTGLAVASVYVYRSWLRRALRPLVPTLTGAAHGAT